MSSSPGSSSDQKSPARTGKKLVPAVAKNMPSVMTVFGRIDEKYRPVLAAEVATAVAQRAHSGESPSSLDTAVYWGSKSIQKKNQECPAPAKLHSPLHNPPSSPNALIERLTDEERLLIASKLSQLEAKLHHHDRVIELRTGELQDLAAMRDLRIAQKKSRVNQLKGTVALNRQRGVTQQLVSSGAVENGLNSNPLVKHRSTPVEMRATPDLLLSMGMTGASAASFDKTCSVGGGVINKERWRDAQNQSIADLEQRAKVSPLVVGKKACGRRTFPQRTESPFAIDPLLLRDGRLSATTDGDGDADVPGEERVKSVADLHRGRKIVMTTHEQWLVREADRCKSGFIEGVVYSRPSRELMAVSEQLRATTATPH